MNFDSIIRKFKYIPYIFIGLPLLIFIRAISPFFLIRFGNLVSTRIGHFVGNTEMYLCERDAGINVPKQKYLDIFYMDDPVCNEQIAKMWKRQLLIVPLFLVFPLHRLNRLVPGWQKHEIGNNTQSDRDVFNLLERFDTHLQFTDSEIAKGEDGLRELGIPKDSEFVCIIVRDSAYTDINFKGKNFEYHNYRNCNVQNCLLAAEKLTNRGLFVVRMGSNVREKLNSNHDKVIDYATNGKRSDFMDVYLSANCKFMISTGTGLDAVAEQTRKPIVFINFIPIGYIHTSTSKIITIPKKHILRKSGRSLSQSEIFNLGVGFSLKANEYNDQEIDLIENTPEEIKQVALEMDDRLNGKWSDSELDKNNQQCFWNIFPLDSQDIYNKARLHGEVRSFIGSDFLKENPEWMR